MALSFPQNKLLVATHNAGKLREFAQLLPLPGITLGSAADVQAPEPEETGSRFEENALLKAQAGAAFSGLATLADDSGFCVEALNDAPGIFSARWAEGKNFAPAFAKIENLLQQKNLVPSGQNAFFICVLALVFPDGTEIVVEGRVNGKTHFPPRGENGFGYDPVFAPENDSRTFAQMTAPEKARYSHRARACTALLEQLNNHR